MSEYLSCAETAKLVRQVLKREFPGVKFTVRSDTYAGGASINIGWTDGPRTGTVDAAVQPYSGAGFDGMTDLKTSHSSWLDPDGRVVPPGTRGARPVQFMADYVFTNRSFSDEYRRRLEQAVVLLSGEDGEFDGNRRYGFGIIPEGEVAGRAYEDYGSTLVWQLSQIDPDILESALRRESTRHAANAAVPAETGYADQRAHDVTWMTAAERERLPHPAVVCDGPQLLSVIEELETGTYPRPEDAIWRDDLPHDLAVRLAHATGATDEQIAEITSQPAPEPPGPEPPVAGESAQVSTDEADITIRHTHEDGTLVYGTSKGDGTAAILKANRFRWFPSIKLWGVAQSRDHLAKRWQIETAAEALRKAGFTVAVEIDDTPRDVADVRADRAGRLDARHDRLTAKAERNMAEAESRSARADQISERFAFGQPILVGHHSERSARADAKRMDGHMRAAQAAYGKAERAQRAASVVGLADAYRDRPAVIIRRIAKAEADLRRVARDIAGEPPPAHRRYYGPERTPASGAWLAQLEARKTFLEHQLAADREALAAHERNGYKQLSRTSVHVGDLVSYWGTERGEVVRVNPKTVSIKTRYTWTNRLPYDEIKSVECPHDGTTVKTAAPAPAEAKPASAAGITERLAEFKAHSQLAAAEPLYLDARTEYFPTPAPVVARMIEAAGLTPDMAVLEPSAGLGAIATRIAPLVASVDCIEMNSQLAGRLRAAGTGTVRCADFLEVPPAPAYDRVLMNPPFSGQADIRHVTHALGFVKPGGMVVAIMSAGAWFRQDKTATAFREMVAAAGGRFERLPEDAFESSGTNVRTVMAVIPLRREP